MTNYKNMVDSKSFFLTTNTDPVIRTFRGWETGFSLLMAVAEVLNRKSPTKSEYTVGDTYFDYGQGWRWTTILCKTPRGDVYQALNPREQGDILKGADPEAIADEILADKYCPDRIRR